jgi:hypothetical protein
VLQRKKNVGSDRDRVHPHMGRRRMTCGTLDFHVETIRKRRDGTGAGEKRSIGQFGPEMQPEHSFDAEFADDARLGESSGTALPLFRRLKDEHHGIPQQIHPGCEELRRTQERCHMCIVTAGMHDSRNTRRKRKARLFIKRQGIHVRPEHCGSPRQVFPQDTHHRRGNTEPLNHPNAFYGRKNLNDPGSGDVLLVGQFGKLMKFSSPGDDILAERLGLGKKMGPPGQPVFSLVLHGRSPSSTVVSPPRSGHTTFRQASAGFHECSSRVRCEAV